jgi:L-alanine-DL-glutamate epimerase-like enolase superfamily enzyme
MGRYYEEELPAMIDRISTAYYRLPLDISGDAGHGIIDTEELVTVTVEADGLTGQGYAYTIGKGGRGIHALIEHDLAPMLVGQDASDVESLWDAMWGRLLYVGRGGLASFAIAAVDIALWDLRGLRQGRPLVQLLGGTAREIPAYGSGVDLPKPLDALLKQVEGFLDRGLPGVKVKVGRSAGEDEARVAAVRDLIGDSIDLMLDANMGWNASEALERGLALERFRPFWLEEPTVPEDVAGHTALAEALVTPIAAGESLHSPHEFRRYIDAHALDVVQVDPITSGGITVARRVLAWADVAGLQTSSHYADELSAHLLCASQNPVYLEKHAFALDPYLESPQSVLNGHVRPTDVPGNGLQFNQRALGPYRE